MRRRVIAEVADIVIATNLEHPVRVGIDGVCGSGKTTFGRELSEELERRGRTVIRIDSDGFHHPAAIRRQNSDPARGYYEDAYDFDSLVSHALVPLGPGGDRTYAPAVLDFASGEPVDQTKVADPNAIVIFECTFIQRGSLRDHWDHVIFLRTDLDIAQQRGVARDADALGGRDAARRAYGERYMEACRIYLAEEHPERRADLVIDNNDPESPRLA